MKLTLEQLSALITNGILAYEPYGSFYRVDNDGNLMSCAMSATSDKSSPLDSDDWGVIDLCLVSDEERVELERIQFSLECASLRSIYTGEVQTTETINCAIEILEHSGHPINVKEILECIDACGLDTEVQA